MIRYALRAPQRLTTQKRSFFGEWWKENVIKPIHSARFPLPDVLGVPATSYMRRAASESTGRVALQSALDARRRRQRASSTTARDDASARSVNARERRQFVYPWPVIIGGYYVMQWAIGRSHDSIGARGERLREAPGFAPAANVDDQRAALQRLLDDAKRRKGGG